MNETYWLWGLVKRETDKAILLDDGCGTAAWCPKSQIIDTEGSAIGEGVILRLEIKAWIVEEKGWNVENSESDFKPKPVKKEDKEYDDDPF